MKNKKGISGWDIFGLIIAVVVILGFILVGTVVGIYNDLVQTDLTVENKFGNLQSAYERRADLIPNLVETVKGSAAFEQETLTQIAKWRGAIRSATTPEQLQEVDRQMTLVTGTMLGYVEAYPNLKASEHFRALMDELAGTENRIKWERDEYNTAVRDYKSTVRKFPNNIISGMFGFESTKWEMYEASEEAQDAPKVSFSK